MTIHRIILPGVLCAMATAPAATAEGEPLAVPSGLAVQLHDLVRAQSDAPGLYRMRFVAPEIAADGTDFDGVVADMDYLCAQVALPHLADSIPAPERIIITLMSTPTDFGLANPAVTQFFESYSIKNDLCIWEAF